MEQGEKINLCNRQDHPLATPYHTCGSWTCPSQDLVKQKISDRQTDLKTERRKTDDY